MFYMAKIHDFLHSYLLPFGTPSAQPKKNQTNSLNFLTVSPCRQKPPGVLTNDINGCHWLGLRGNLFKSGSKDTANKYFPLPLLLFLSS